MTAIAAPVMADRVHARRWVILPVLCLSVLLAAIDNTIVNVALPTITRKLGASTTDLQWIVDAYTVTFAGLLLVCGSVGDRFGRKRVLQAGMSLFVLASIGAAISSTVPQLVAARAVMGLAVALAYPSTLALLMHVFRERTERAIAVGVWSGVSGLAIGLGPVVGGLLLEHFAWGSIFLVNVPVGLIALALGAAILPESQDPSPGKPDWAGIVISVELVSLLVWTVIEAPTRGWLNVATLTGFAGSAVLLAMFVWWEPRCAHPLLDVRLFTNPRFSVSSGAISIAFFCLFGFIFSITTYFQVVRGYSPLHAGAATLPYAAVMGILSPVGMLANRWLGAKVLVVGGMLLMAAGYVVVAISPIDADYWTVIVVAMCLMASGMAFVTSPSTDAILAAVPPERAGVGSAVNDTTREFGGALGVAIVGSVLSSYYASHLSTAWHHLGVGSGALLTAGRRSLSAALVVSHHAPAAERAALVHTARASFWNGLHAGSIVTAIAAGVGAVVALLFLPARDRPLAS